MDLKALTLHESINDRRGFTADINNIGVDYLRRNEPDLALDYLFRAKALAEKDADTIRRMIVMNNIARAYITRGMMDSARVYIQQSYELAEIIPLVVFIVFCSPIAFIFCSIKILVLKKA